MEPFELKSKIFLDSGDLAETQKTIDMLGFLDGQTTNPSLIIKSPEVQERIKNGKKYTKEEILEEYKKIIHQISEIIPDGDISIEVYANKSTKAEEMVQQAHQMYKWIKNGRIKLPTNSEGLKAAEILSKENMRLNMTLCFTQQQAAAVYSATKMNSNKVFISPFQARLNDNGFEGIDLIRNIIKMYRQSDKHVEVLSASIRDLNHLLYCLYLHSDIITVPYKVLVEWFEMGMKIPDSNVDKDFFDENDFLQDENVKNIIYEELDLNKNWNEFDISHPLTDAGIEKFSKDWDSVSS